jgi:class 3 adenylate cyclase/predicted ATPase
MLQIADWLEKLGLSQYAERFVENGIDVSVLRYLTEQDLEKIGVLLGHRRKMLAAIAALEGGAPIPQQPLAKTKPQDGVERLQPASISTAPPAITAGNAENVGERRYLTVMFCDLVGSTAISAQLDAEEWRDLVGSYLDAASAAVAEMGGHVAKKLGDGLMSLFGYPVAHENDAERAARAALSIQRALADLNRKNAGTAKPELVARIGLESGPAVLDASGEIYGDVANIAARVQALAEPGAVLVTGRVQRQVAGLFVAEDRGTQALKGVAEPTALFRLVRASGGGRRSGQRNLTPLVGRDEEIATLIRRWERARQGDGQLVLIVGEPGLGKSRLIEEFHLRLKETPHTWVEWSCSQLLQNTPLHPVGEWGRQRFGGPDVPAERRIADLENTLAQVKLDPLENASLLAPLLDIPLPKERVSALAPEELRRRQLAALTSLVMAGAKVQPVVLAFEDLHWADPTTLDVLHGIAERGALVPLYIVATARPEFRPPWGMRSHHGTLSLAPLDRAQVREMVAELSARHALAGDVVDDVAARTGGVPLFIEEVTRLLLERGEQGGAQAIPPTLQQSLMARLDRLGSAREVALIGSVIGRGFSYKLLKTVTGMDDVSLETALEKLSDADIVLVEGVLPESNYRFKHALIQDSAYENLLKSRRQVLHRRIAETLRDRFADKAAVEPEVLAHHFTQAGLTDAAIDWWGKAGDQALRRSAFQEAISHLGKAIEMADKADESAQQTADTSPSQRLKLQTSYGQVLMLSRGFGSAESKAAFTRAQQLAARIDDAAERFDTTFGLWIGNLARAELRLARETAEIFLREAEIGPSMTEAVVAHRCLGLTSLMQGELAYAHEHLLQALSLYDPERDREARFRFAQEPDAGAKSYLALTYWQFGEIERASEMRGEAVARAVNLAHPQTLVNVHHFRSVLEILRGDAESARRAAEAVLELSQEHGITLYLSVGTVSLAWARARLSNSENGTTELREALAAFIGQGNRWFVPFYQGLLAELEAEREGAEGASIRIDEALALAQETGEHWTDPFLHRIRGEILLKRDPANTAPAEEAFLAAISIAQERKARSYELQAALSLAKLYQSTNRAADAHTILATALEGFSLTPEFPEIAKAQAMLAALAETEEVKNAAAARERRLKLQTSYGQAMMWSKGYGAQEAKIAFTRARELGADVQHPAERLPTYYGLWIGNLVRGELAAAQTTANSFLRDVETAASPAEVGAARRALGQTYLWQGDFRVAQTHFQEALKIYDSDRDREVKFRFGMDTGASSKALLAVANWVLGDAVRARDLIEGALALAVELGHVPTLGPLYFHGIQIEMMRGDADLALRFANTMVELGRDREMPIFLLLGTTCRGWARAQLGEREAGIAELLGGLTAYTERGNKLYVPFLQGLLSELEAENQNQAGAVIQIEEALTIANRTGEHWADSFLYRIRGETLLKGEPANSAPAEEAFLVAIAIAKEQKAKSFELRAALSLSRLYQATGRAAAAHAVLAPALEGFSPTPEFPEIDEAQKLLAVLTQTDAVKDVTAARERRLKLQTSYGNALMAARGYQAPETTAAFATARNLAAGIGGTFERFSVYYGQWAGSFVRGDLASMTEIARTMLGECTDRQESPEAGVAFRLSGETDWFAGNFLEARASLERALANFDPERDRELAFRFGQDVGVTAMGFLACVLWPLGHVDHARRLNEDMMALAFQNGHAASIAFGHFLYAVFEVMFGDSVRAAPHVAALGAFARDHGMKLWAAYGTFLEPWMRFPSGGDELNSMRRGIETLREQGVFLYAPLFGTALAGAELRASDFETALATIDRAIAKAESTGQRWFAAESYRVRGEILWKRDAADAASAEEAFVTAIAIAQRQKAKSFELRAALSLAQLYLSSGRAADAKSVLVPALEGFSPTPEFSEIGEARMLIAELA